MVTLDPDNEFMLSASDLTATSYCEFAWFRKVDERLGRVPPIDDSDSLRERAARLGDAHEERHLERLRTQHDVIQIPRPNPYTPENLAEAAAQTTEALRNKVPVLAQGAFFDGGFGGMADFLVLDGTGAYEVWDAKLARREKPPALVQIAAYTDQLDRLGIPRSATAALLLGDDNIHRRPIDDVIAVYRHQRHTLETKLRAHLGQPDPVAWNDERYRFCGKCPQCEAEIESRNDLLQVAGLSRDQRSKLRTSGITTVGELADASTRVDGLTTRTFDRLRAQAALQRDHHERPQVELFDHDPIHALPRPNDGDIFFDFEGDPLWTATNGRAESLEYLFGILDLDDSDAGLFTPLWAHDRAEERSALIGFFDYVSERRARHPGLHIYHYAPYEVTALKRLTVRHSYGEDLLDDLLREGVFVDLYRTVRQSIRVSESSYSIKKLEPLYMGTELRDDSGVTTAADSILQYQEYVDAQTRGDHVEAQRILDDIADYNRYDCLSTWRLRDWLLTLAPSAGPTVATYEGPDVDLEPGVDELVEVAERLLERIPTENRSEEQQGLALLAAALGYFRREDKPLWWAYFDREVSPVDEWLDPRGTLVADEPPVVTQPWSRSGRQRKPRRHLRVIGRLEPGSPIKEGANVRGVYEDVPEAAELNTGALRFIGKDSTVVEVTSDGPGRDVVVIEESAIDDTGHPELPTAIFEFTYINKNALESAVIRAVHDILAQPSATLPADPAFDILARRPPRLAGDAVFNGSVDDPAAYVDAVHDAVAALDHSYVAVQGPPGTGKTYVGAHVVARLAQSGWRIGVVAQSHSTIGHFLTQVAAAGADIGLPNGRIGQKPKSGDKTAGDWAVLKNNDTVADFLQGRGVVVGGTAWAFANEDLPRLDLLVVDEAGQFSLANTIAASRAADRLLLLGDPQQLPQVTQGGHPEPVDTSALAWLAHGHDTMPPDRGFFLAATRRMHSALAAPVSTLAYDGRLGSVTEVTNTRSLDGAEPGLHALAVDHTGNAVQSVEESEAVVDVIRGLLGCPWSPGGDEDDRPLEPADVIVVAPYNAQVALLRRNLDDAGFPDTEVGTVDKFQGREAAISIVSMTASSPADIPRGIDFLLDRHRLNVAISRGQWAAYLLYSPRLRDAHPTTPEDLDRLGAFLRLVGSV